MLVALNRVILFRQVILRTQSVVLFISKFEIFLDLPPLSSVRTLYLDGPLPDDGRTPEINQARPPTPTSGCWPRKTKTEGRGPSCEKSVQRRFF